MSNQMYCPRYYFAIMELSDWAERHGAGDVADSVRGALETIDKNEELIKLTLAVLMAPE